MGMMGRVTVERELQRYDRGEQTFVTSQEVLLAILKELRKPWWRRVTGR